MPLQNLEPFARRQRQHRANQRDVNAVFVVDFILCVFAGLVLLHPSSVRQAVSATVC